MMGSARHRLRAADGYPLPRMARRGPGPEAATVATLDTAGRPVLLAGSTVIISMLGLFAVGLSFMHGTALVTIVAVLVVMAAPSRCSRRCSATSAQDRPAAYPVAPPEPYDLGRGHLARQRLAAVESAGTASPRPRRVTGVALLLALAAPFLGVRFGFPDAGNDPEGTSTRARRTTVADVFGPGANGPLLLVAELPRVAPRCCATRSNRATRGSPASRRSPAPGQPGRRHRALTVVPTTGPQDPATETSCTTARRRDPGAIEGTGAPVHVGGATAGVDRLDRQHRRAGSRCSSVAWSCSRCFCCWWRSAVSPSLSRRPR